MQTTVWNQTVTHRWFRKSSLTPSSLHWLHCSFIVLKQSIEHSINVHNPLSPCKFILILQWLLFFLLYLKWSINYSTESQNSSSLPDKQIPLSSIPIKDNIVGRGGGWVIKSIHVPPTDRVMSRHGEFQYAPIFQDLHVHVEFPIISRADSETIKLLTCFQGSLGHLLIVSLYLHQHQLAFVRIYYWCFNLSSISFTSLRLQGTINKYRHQRGNMPWCAIS